MEILLIFPMRILELKNIVLSMENKKPVLCLQSRTDISMMGIHSILLHFKMI